MSRGLVLLFAVAVGQAVASNHLLPPLLGTIRGVFGVSSSVAGLVATASQLGYAAGLVLLLPLGDLLERRRIVITLALLTAAGLAVAATAPTIGFFLVSCGVVGLTSVMAQLLVPFAATLAPEAERGRVVGNVMSGLIVGTLLARTFSGIVADAAGWRAVYVLASALMVVQAVVLFVKLPRLRPAAGLPYHRLLASTAGLGFGEPVLRRRSFYGLLAFAAFSVLWTTLAFQLSGPAFGYGEAVIGLFGLAGAAGAVSASVVGRFTDRGLGHVLTGGGCGLMLLGFLLLWMGRGSLGPLLAGIVVLDIGASGIQITSQSEIYRMQAEARNRINSFFMTACFVGAAAGSALAAFAYGRWGWAGTCTLGALRSLAAAGRWATDAQRPAARRQLHYEAQPPL